MTNHQPKSVWQAVLGELQVQVTRPSYETWLKDTVGLAHQNGEFIVGTPNSFVAEMLEQRMYSLISQAMERVTKKHVDVRFCVQPADGGSNGYHVEPPAAESLPGKSAPAVPSRRPTRLNPRYTFENFIVGKSNELAHAAAVAVAENPGTTYNPLVIYSDVGLGKTHLLHAIGRSIQARGSSVTYATTEEFTNQYIKAIREGKTEEFRDEYRNTDALLLDDIQFLIGKEQTQEGFFHTFNALHMANRQIVITSDRPVASLTLLEGRVTSRLSGGLVVDVQAPDIETRLAILRANSEQLGMCVPPEVLQFLAERIHRNIRELEGNLNRVLVYAQLTSNPITVELVNRAIADSLGPSARRQVSPESIMEAVASYFQIDRELLKGPRGKKEVSLARQIAMHLMRTDADLGPSAIGRVLGGKDHSTVVKNCAKITSQLDIDPHLRRDVLNIRDCLSSS